MATHSSILAWKIPRREETSRLQSMGSQKSQTQPSAWAEQHTAVLKGLIMFEQGALHFHSALGPTDYVAGSDGDYISHSTKSFWPPTNCHLLNWELESLDLIRWGSWQRSYKLNTEDRSEKELTTPCGKLEDSITHPILHAHRREFISAKPCQAVSIKLCISYHIHGGLDYSPR